MPGTQHWWKEPTGFKKWRYYSQEERCISLVPGLSIPELAQAQTLQASRRTSWPDTLSQSLQSPQQQPQTLPKDGSDRSKFPPSARSLHPWDHIS